MLQVMQVDQMVRLPTFFIPHGGGPCFFMDWHPKGAWDEMAQYLKSFANDIRDDIKAIIVISAHWEEDIIKVTGNSNPELIYDYHGFPPHTYDLKWPAKGNKVLANQISSILNAGGIACAVDEDRGFDHGVFIPLLLTFPEANIPTIQVSLCSTLSPKTHLQIGKLLQPLRDQGVLIIGSGMSYHDVSALMGRKEVIGSDTFDHWLSNSMLMPSEQREAALLDWAAAPSARLCHPREEHLLPLHVIAGAATGGKGMIDFNDTVLGATISAYQFQ
jgi:aromatic ring-opening dioxygenase catalytic subunit (LigB family)